RKPVGSKGSRGFESPPLRFQAFLFRCSMFDVHPFNISPNCCETSFTCSSPSFGFTISKTPSLPLSFIPQTSRPSSRLLHSYIRTRKPGRQVSRIRQRRHKPGLSLNRLGTNHTTSPRPGHIVATASRPV